jgi:hypothetical protein
MITNSTNCHLNVEEEMAKEAEINEEDAFTERMQVWEHVQQFLKVSKDSETVQPPRKFRSHPFKNSSLIKA